MEHIKQKIQRGELVHGTWLSLGNASNAELMGQAGFDWVMIDLEHGQGAMSDLLAQLHALEAFQTAVFVRIPNHDSSSILKVLDLGADGVMVPRIANFDQAKRAVDSMFYPPLGTRGLAPAIRATQYGASASTYYDQAEAHTLGILQIETASVLPDLDEIVKLRGVDLLFLGPADLTLALGIFGQYDHKLYLDAVRKTVSAATNAGKAVGILLVDEDDYQKYCELGVTVIGSGSDTSFLRLGALKTAQALKTRRRKFIGADKP